MDTKTQQQQRRITGAQAWTCYATGPAFRLYYTWDIKAREVK